MPLNTDSVGFATSPMEVSWTSRDTLLYALGVGAGALDPTAFELEFTTENSAGHAQQVLPTFPVVLPRRDGWVSQIGEFDPATLVHGEQSLSLHAPIPVEGRVSLVTTITGIFDKGSGAVVVTETVASDGSKGALWTTVCSLFLRGEGGWGGERGPSTSSVLPDRHPDHVVRYPTRSDQALLYRLSGDRNPLHSDPSFATRAGFDKPILHGLCTFGFTGRALLHTLCHSDPSRFRSMSARFSRPVQPGETLSVSIWITGADRANFRTATSAGAVIDAGAFAFDADTSARGSGVFGG